MRFQRRLVFALPFLGLAPLAFSIEPQPNQSDRPAVAAASAAAQEDEESPLEVAMGQMQGGMRALGRAMRSPEGADAALRAVEQIRGGLISALPLEPHYPKEMQDATEQKRFRNAFQRGLVATLDTTLQLEDAMLAGEKDKATELFGKLRAHKDEGHEKFQLEEEDH